MKLKPLKNIQDYCAIAEPRLGVFASKKWLSVYESELTVVGIFRDDEQLIGGFYYLDTKKAGLRFIKLPPYTPYCGLVYNSESSNPSARAGFSKEVMTAVCNYLKAQKPALLILAMPPEIVDMQPFIWEKFKVIPNYTNRIDLNKDLPSIISGFDPKNRNIINKVQKDGVEIKSNDLSADQLYKFFSNALQAAGANVYRNQLKRIFEQLSDYQNSFCWTAYRENELLGAVYCVFDKNACYYLLGGTDKNNKVNGVNNLLVLKSIEKAKELACQVFDFEGSMLKGVEKFFRSFGPELYPYYTVNKAWKPLELLLKFKKPEVF